MIGQILPKIHIFNTKELFLRMVIWLLNARYFELLSTKEADRTL